MKKNDKLHIPISTEDKQRLKKKAEQLGMNLTQFILFVSLNAKIGEVEIVSE